MGIWRIEGKGVRQVKSSILNFERRLEDILSQNIEVVSPNWFVIGRQVRTAHGGFIDLLAMDRDSNLVVLELKKDRTPRDIIAQLLDYGSWVTHLEIEDIAEIFDQYQRRLGKDGSISIEDAYNTAFNSNMPDEINRSHELVIVAADLDYVTERVVKYLAKEYGVNINAVFFKVFRDGNQEYLSRAWLRDPIGEAVETVKETVRGKWNGEYYVSFGYPQEIICDGLKRGYIVAGGGLWYSRTLEMLEAGARVWVHVPEAGYVGVGIVSAPMEPVDKFMIKDEIGNEVPLTRVFKPAASLNPSDAQDKTDYLVRIDWLKTVALKDAKWEKGFFANQNSAARPRAAKWDYTIKRLKHHFGIE